MLEAEARLLGKEHPDTLTSMNNLALTLYAQGDLSGARTLQEQVLEGGQGPAPWVRSIRSTLTSMLNLAGTLSAQGDLAGAHTLKERVLKGVAPAAAG